METSPKKIKVKRWREYDIHIMKVAVQTTKTATEITLI